MESAGVTKLYVPFPTSCLYVAPGLMGSWSGTLACNFWETAATQICTRSQGISPTSLKLIWPDGKWSVVVKLYGRVCIMYIKCINWWMYMYILHTHIYRYERVYTMYIFIIKFIYVYVHTTYIYVLLCTCTYMNIHVHEWINMYIQVCTMFRHVYTVLQYPVHVGRIPDGYPGQGRLALRSTAKQAACIWPGQPGWAWGPGQTLTLSSDCSWIGKSVQITIWNPQKLNMPDQQTWSWLLLHQIIFMISLCSTY